MEPPPKIWFFYEEGGALGYTSINLDDSQTIVDDIIPTVATRLSIFPLTLIPPARITVWKRICHSDLRVYRYKIAPYICPGDEPVSLFVHLVPAFPRGKKHALEEANNDLVKMVKLSKIIIQSPSSLAQPHTFRALHQLYQANPSWTTVVSMMLETVLGASILLKTISPPSHFNMTDFWSLSRHLPWVQECSGDEDGRRGEGLDALVDIFSQRTDNVTFTLTAACASENTNSGSYFLGPHRAAYCVIKFTNESGCGSAIPYVEMTGHFAQSMGKAADHFDSISVMRGWNLPCLGITIAGTVTVSRDRNDRIALYDAFTAASVLLARIQGDATKLVHRPPLPIRESRRILPAVSRLCHPRSETHMRFNTLAFFHNPDRYLYTAETIDNKQTIVKFTRRCSFELHMFCADRGCAPALFGFERLPGGFFGIAVEFVRPAFPISHSPHVEKHCEWVDKSRNLFEFFHAEGFVHGALRVLNIICDGNRVMLVDFDWGGKEGEVSYPHGPLNADLMVGRESTDLKITKGDDVRVLERTLKGVRLR
ncbi:hypothetical protein EDD16DRAFT_1805539 [Pisolithus croceorrhizus]|nr:hypothetical protein EDD16DRAFT_1805539 [Pisolithus croceorrhizus]KAI6114884.1 hypothetical protein EV401DRAFT_2211085 [Pisolithus croceorrhizus]